MIGMRKFLGLLMAMMLAVFALPSVAGSGTKSFYAEFPTVSATSTVSVIFHNTSSAPGISTINSARIDVTAPAGVTITGVRMTAPTVVTTPALGVTGLGTNSVIITNFPGIKSHADGTFELTLSGVSGNCTAVQFFAYANSGNAYPQGDEFIPTRTDLLTTSVNCDGVLKCPSLPSTVPGIYNYTEISGANTTTLVRYENKDGSACVPIPFNVSFSDANRQVTFYWDQVSQPYAALQTLTTWPLALANGAAGLPNPTQYSLDGTNFNYAPTCLSSLAPAPYGTLVSDAGGTTIVIDTVTAPPVGTLTPLPAAPFAIVIASNVPGVHPERLLVQSYTAVSGGYQLTVIRGTGGMTQTTHAVGASVMSTPLPVAADSLNGVVGNQVPVCIIEENFKTQPYGTLGCPAQASTATDNGVFGLKGCFQGTTKLFLLGDVVLKTPG